MIIVANAEDRPTRRSQQTNQQQVGWCEVLELIDQHHPACPLSNPTSLGLRQQHQERSVNLVVEINRTLPFERGAIARPRCRQPFDVAVIASFGVGGGHQPETNQAERLDPGGDGVAVAATRKRHKVADDPPNINFVDRVPSCRLRGKRSGAVDDREGHGIECSNLEAGQVGGALDHLLLGTLIEGDEDHGGCRKIPGAEKVSSSLGQHTSFARASWGDDARRPAAVGDSGELVGCKVGLGDVVPGRGERTVLDGNIVDDGDTIDRIGVADWPAVEPKLSSVRCDDVAQLVTRGSGCASSDCTVERNPGTSILANVDSIRPDGVVQRLELEHEVSTHLERLCIGLQHRLTVEVDSKFDDQALP